MGIREEIKNDVKILTHSKLVEILKNNIEDIKNCDIKINSYKDYIIDNLGVVMKEFSFSFSVNEYYFSVERVSNYDDFQKIIEVYKIIDGKRIDIIYESSWSSDYIDELNENLNEDYPGEYLISVINYTNHIEYIGNSGNISITDRNILSSIIRKVNLIL